MFNKLYEQLWEVIDPLLYAVGSGVSFAIWMVIF